MSGSLGRRQEEVVNIEDLVLVDLVPVAHMVMDNDLVTNGFECVFVISCFAFSLCSPVAFQCYCLFF